MEHNETNTTDAPPVTATGQRRRPRVVLGTFWAVISLLLFVAGFHGFWQGIVAGVATAGYSVYLYRGGRYGVWFLPF